MDIRDLYQEVIIDHNRHPRNFHEITAPCSQAQGFNPLCGDKITLYLKLEGDLIQDIGFQGEGCAISTASASLMTEALKGKTVTEAKTLFHEFHTAMMGATSETDPQLGKLEVLMGVKAYPVRVKCATLAWHTFQSALEQSGQVATTE